MSDASSVIDGFPPRITASENRASSILSITVRGRGGHGSAPHLTVDPIVILARLIVRLQAFVARELAPEDQVLIRVSTVDAGTTHNVIPDDARVTLSLGAADADALRTVRDRIQAIVIAECLASGCESPPDFSHTVDAVLIGATA